MLRQTSLLARASRFLSASGPQAFDTFVAISSRKAKPTDYPLASSIQKNIPVYDLPSFQTLSQEQRSSLQAEWYDVLYGGPGVFVTKGLYTDRALLDRVTSTFNTIIQKEKESGASHGDHFAGAGKNDRIWNSFGKHGLTDPASFVSYYSNPWLGLICSSWLGPGYRITAQANNVKPGADAQVCHRDYHLGFMSKDRCAQFPGGIQVASQFLTLQGAVAHVDVPEESGPTRLLPHSQMFEPGYLAYHEPEYREWFLQNYVALPLEKGDGLFFNPALFHAAGTNQSKDIHRMVNLVQISSAFGKPMESIDTFGLVESSWEDLARLYRGQGLSDDVKAFVAAAGEGYAFPTNLDIHEPKAGSMAPESEQDIILDALQRGASKGDVLEKLRVYTVGRQA